MSLADEIEEVITWSLGPTLGKGIINGCYSYLGITRDELRKENVEGLISALKASLPHFIGEQATEGLVEKIRDIKEAA